MVVDVIEEINMYTKRMKLAFVLSPLFPALYMLAMPYFTGSTFTGRYDVVFIILFSLPVSYLSCAILGAPFVYFLRKNGHLNTLNVVAGGAVFGAIVFYLFGFLFSAFLDSNRNILPEFRELMFGVMLGVLVALPFGLIAGIPFRGEQKDH